MKGGRSRPSVGTECAVAEQDAEPRRGEIWVVSLDPKKGSEVGKQRPALVIQTDLLNDVGHPTVIIAPISSQIQEVNVLRFKLENTGLQKGFGYVLIDQIRTVDASLRLKKRIGKIKGSELEAVGLLLKQVLNL